MTGRTIYCASCPPCGIEHLAYGFEDDREKWIAAHTEHGPRPSLWGRGMVEHDVQTWEEES